MALLLHKTVLITFLLASAVSSRYSLFRSIWKNQYFIANSFHFLANSAKTSPKNEAKPIVENVDNIEEVRETDANVTDTKNISSFLSSAWTKVEGFTRSTTSNFAKEGKSN